MLSHTRFDLAFCELNLADDPVQPAQIFDTDYPRRAPASKGELARVSISKLLCLLNEPVITHKQAILLATKSEMDQGIEQSRSQLEQRLDKIEFIRASLCEVFEQNFIEPELSEDSTSESDTEGPADAGTGGYHPCLVAICASLRPSYLTGSSKTTRQSSLWRSTTLCPDSSANDLGSDMSDGMLTRYH